MLIATLFAASVALAPPEDALLGVWADYENTQAYVFHHEKLGRFVEAERFGAITDGKFVPDGSWTANVEKVDYPPTGYISLGTRNSLKRNPGVSGQLRLQILKSDADGYPTSVQPAFAMGSERTPSAKPNWSYVCGLKSVIMKGAYAADGIRITIDTDRTTSTGKLYMDKELDIQFRPNKEGGPAFIWFGVIDRATGAEIGQGAIAWCPTPSVIGKLRSGSILPTDRAFVAVVAGKQKRWTYLTRQD